MKQAVLNQTQLRFLEEILLRYGIVVTYAEIAALVPANGDAGKRQFVSRLVQAGWLVRIKNGVYQIADLSSLGTLTLSRYAIATILVPESYVSFEGALQFHGLHDQMMQTLTSVSLRQHTATDLNGLTYRYVKTREEFFFGFETHIFDGQESQIATAEKALIDLVQLHRTAYTSDRVAEVLTDNGHQLDLDRLNQYLERANLTTQRIFGLLLEKLGIGYDNELLRRVQSTAASTRLTPDSSTYNAKWRLYYDPDLLGRYSIAGNGL